jgi:hypothetical protein
MYLHKRNHQLLKHQFSSSTIYFVVTKFTLENMNGHERDAKTYTQVHQIRAVQSRGLSQRKLPTKAYIYTNTIDSN